MNKEKRVRKKRSLLYSQHIWSILNERVYIDLKIKAEEILDRSQRKNNLVMFIGHYLYRGHPVGMDPLYFFFADESDGSGCP